MKTPPWFFYVVFLALIITFVIYLVEDQLHILEHQITGTGPLFSTVRTNVNENYKNIMREFIGTNRSLTIVTGYFNIGKFPKGSAANIRTPQKYENWLSVFGRIQNPVVFYTDSVVFAKTFNQIRNNTSNRTKIVIIQRDKLWSFQIMPRIAKLYSSSGYPRHYPNTYIPAYTSMTHSKIPVLLDAIHHDFFSTQYYCWLDVGYFREIVGRNKTFWLEVPNGFDSKRVGVTRVVNMRLTNIKPKTIIYGNLNWIGGGLFLGTPDVLVKFGNQYKLAVMRYLNQSLMNVEQHILYSMFTEDERKAHPLDVDVQLYIPGSQKVMSQDPWFYLGYLMYTET